MEKDDEIKGSGNHLAFGDYGYDPRLGRRWNIDPMAHEMPDISPYKAFFNNPIIIQDPTGEFGIAGFLIGFAVDVGVQMLANSLAVKSAPLHLQCCGIRLMPELKSSSIFYDPI